MNDIQLKKSSNNTYDWEFRNGDLVDVVGDARLVSAIRHALLLKSNELEQVAYTGQGNKLTDIIKSNDVNSAEEIVKETFEQTLRAITGIQDATVTLIIRDDATINITLAKIIKDNGEEIEIGL